MAIRSKKHIPKDGPFDRKLFERAGDLASRYRIVLKPETRSGFLGTVLEIPTVFSTGASPDECVRKVRDALTVAVASLMEAGVRPPQPVSEGQRQEQMNIRLDPEEKLLLKEAASQRGFRSVSDYVRAIALGDAREGAPIPIPIARAPRQRRASTR